MRSDRDDDDVGFASQRRSFSLLKGKYIKHHAAIQIDTQLN